MNENFNNAWKKIELSETASERIKNAIESGNKEIPVKKHRPKFLLVAAMIALSISVVAVAAELSKINMNVRGMEIDGRNGDYVIEFTSMDNNPVELGYWYPEAIPEEYEVSFDDGTFLGKRTVIFKKNENDFFTFAFFKTEYKKSFDAKNVKSVEKCKVGEAEGYIFTFPMEPDYSEHRVPVNQEDLYIKYSLPETAIVWTDAEKGIGFILDYVGEEDYDIIAIAESVAEIEAPEENSYYIYYQAALRKLGDYQPGYLPEGYSETQTAGMPASIGCSGDYYGFVYRLYENPEFYDITLIYEFIPYSEDWRAFYNSFDINEDKTVFIGETEARFINYDGNRRIGLIWEEKVWEDRSVMLTFTLTANGVSEDELLKIAENMTCVSEADSKKYFE